VSGHFISDGNGGRNYAVSTMANYNDLNLPAAPPLAVAQSNSPGTTSFTPPSSFGDRNNWLAHDSLCNGFTMPCAHDRRAPLHQTGFFPKFLIPYAAAIFGQKSSAKRYRCIYDFRQMPYIARWVLCVIREMPRLHELPSCSSDRTTRGGMGPKWVLRGGGGKTLSSTSTNTPSFSCLEGTVPKNGTEPGVQKLQVVSGY
jgi:hypothetical protein